MFNMAQQFSPRKPEPAATLCHQKPPSFTAGQFDLISKPSRCRRSFSSSLMAIGKDASGLK
jgi:hypothetical protein